MGPSTTVRYGGRFKAFVIPNQPPFRVADADNRDSFSVLVELEKHLVFACHEATVKGENLFLRCRGMAREQRLADLTNFHVGGAPIAEYQIEISFSVSDLPITGIIMTTSNSRFRFSALSAPRQ